MPDHRNSHKLPPRPSALFCESVCFVLSKQLYENLCIETDHLFGSERLLAGNNSGLGKVGSHQLTHPVIQSLLSKIAGCGTYRTRSWNFSFALFVRVYLNFWHDRPPSLIQTQHLADNNGEINRREKAAAREHRRQKLRVSGVLRRVSPESGPRHLLL